MKTLKYKSGGRVNDVDLTKRIVTGFYTNSESLDSDEDIIKYGAFEKTIREWGPEGKKRIWHLYNHDMDKPVNKPYLIEERKEGVYFELKMLNHPVSSMLLELYQNGAITEHSVGFTVIKGEPLENRRGMIIQETKMYEGSSVLWGANENTPFVGMKSEDIARQLNALENLLKNGTFEKDEVYTIIQNEIEKLSTIVHSLKPAAPLEPSKKAIDVEKLIKLFDN